MQGQRLSVTVAKEIPVRDKEENLTLRQSRLHRLASGLEQRG